MCKSPDPAVTKRLSFGHRASKKIG